VRISALTKQHFGAPLADTLGGQWQCDCSIGSGCDRLGGDFPEIPVTAITATDR
jgi:hypothetical protein